MCLHSNIGSVLTVPAHHQFSFLTIVRDHPPEVRENSEDIILKNRAVPIILRPRFEPVQQVGEQQREELPFLHPLDCSHEMLRPVYYVSS